MRHARLQSFENCSHLVNTLRSAFKVDPSFTVVPIDCSSHHPGGSSKPGQEFTQMALGKEGGNSKFGSCLQLNCLGKVHQPFVSTRHKEELEAIGAVKGGGEGGEDEERYRGGHVLLIKQIQQAALQSSGKQTLEWFRVITQLCLELDVLLPVLILVHSREVP